MLPTSLTTVERWSLSLLAGGLSVMLGVAAWLTPSPDGIGTHQQLGLPACTAILIFGIRCPACGMTTSWAWMMEGGFAEAIRVNVAGVMLFLVAFTSIPWLLWNAWRGERRGHMLWTQFAILGVVIALMIALILWAAQFVPNR